MTIGPEPTIMIFLRSVRRGIWVREPSTLVWRGDTSAARKNPQQRRADGGERPPARKAPQDADPVAAAASFSRAVWTASRSFLTFGNRAAMAATTGAGKVTAVTSVTAARV